MGFRVNDWHANVNFCFFISRYTGHNLSACFPNTLIGTVFTAGHVDVTALVVLMQRVVDLGELEL